MFRKILETIIGGAIGLGTLYLVAKVAYEAGHDMAQAEQEYETYTAHKKSSDDEEERKADSDNDPKENAETIDDRIPDDKPRKHRKLSMIMALRRAFGKGNGSVLGDLVNDPEDHKLEAWVKEGEVHINIKKRRSLATANAG